MEGFKLFNCDENETVVHQEKRGSAEKNPFESKSFRQENRLSLDLTYMFDTPEETSISRQDIETLVPRVTEAQRMLKAEEGDIFDGSVAMTGWQNLPKRISKKHLKEIKSATESLAGEIDAFVTLGIGGSYLGTEATFRALTHTYFNQLNREKRGGAPEIYFLGQNMDPDYFRDILDMLEGKRIGVNVISKSGTTTETALAFRIILGLMEKN